MASGKVRWAMGQGNTNRVWRRIEVTIGPGDDSDGQIEVTPHWDFELTEPPQLCVETMPEVAASVGYDYAYDVPGQREVFIDYDGDYGYQYLTSDSKSVYVQYRNLGEGTLRCILIARS